MTSKNMNLLFFIRKYYGIFDRSLVLCIIFVVTIHAAIYYIGLVMYARYQNCDPYTFGVPFISYMLSA